VLVHGGLGPELTWERQHQLAERWTLLIPTRRGFAGGDGAERQDFERDAEDLLPLLTDGAHLVGFSYGGLGAAIAAERAPSRVRSLTLIEPPLYLAAPDHEGVEELASAGDEFLSGEADPGTEAAFLALAGLTGESAARHRDEIERATLAARGGRSPREARPDLDAIAASAVPAMVVSGDHHPAIEALCDALAERLGARREALPGAGHAVPRAAGFNALLEDFLRSTDND
jgi:pimeloyl-ACP methyl ester carboxylesterase